MSAVQVHGSGQVELECGCVQPSGPYCDEFERLAREKAVAYADMLDADEDLVNATTEYGEEQARAQYEKAQERYEELREAYRDHRTGPVKEETAQPGRDPD